MGIWGVKCPYTSLISLFVTVVSEHRSITRETSVQSLVIADPLRSEKVPMLPTASLRAMQLYGVQRPPSITNGGHCNVFVTSGGGPPFGAPLLWVYGGLNARIPR